VKRILLTILIFLTAIKAFTNHIVGGEVFYKYLGAGNTAGTSVYQVSLRLFRDCDVPCGDGTGTACLPTIAAVAIYPLVSPYTPFYAFSLPLIDSSAITLTTYPNCIANRPPVCYEIKTYSTIVTLPDNDSGYIIAYQNCCRAASENQFGLDFTASGIPGATYTATIPGKSVLPAEHNNSAIFKLKDTALVCSQGRLAINFSADDADGDSLSYALAPAYNGGLFYSDGCIYTDQTGLVCDGTVAGPPPYNYIIYNTALGFSGIEPLGAGVIINPATGLINGIAPSIPGHYIVNVFAYEWRHGKIIAMHQKDFIIHVEDCNIPQAKLDSVFETCKGLNLSFENNSNSPLIYSYYWDFGDVNNMPDTSVSASPVHTYADSGTYVVTLITNKDAQCSDTATAFAKIYPGFTPDFSANGGCISVPYQFTDLTKSKNGTVDTWKWDFGDFSATSDTSIFQNPEYSYTAIQQAQVILIAGDTKGCVDTVKKIISVYDKVPLQLPFKDTLICEKDTLQLHSADSIIASVLYNWYPPLHINNPNIPNPIIYPDSTTIYHIVANNNGCINTDSVKVNVTPFVTINLGDDTTICLTDSIQLFPVTNATYFTWSPSAGISDIKAKNPFVRPLTTTEYNILAAVGNCNASDSIKINTVPYPQVTSMPDTTVCYGKTVPLYANTTAPYFTWSPSNSLLHSNTLTPIAGPQATTSYVITVKDVQGCPKPVSDTTVVVVIPVKAFAGNDTTIVANQPLQLNATGGASYIWSPVIGMDDPYIANPVVTLGPQYDSVIYHVTASTNGCSARDDIKVTVFKTQADIFIPSAFTPNHDGLNDIIRPTLIGIKQFNYFRIYNRWGQMIYNTSATNHGWDGSFSGNQQPSGSYVYMAQAIDYTGRIINKKGTIVLIR